MFVNRIVNGINAKTQAFEDLARASYVPGALRQPTIDADFPNQAIKLHYPAAR